MLDRDQILAAEAEVKRLNTEKDATLEDKKNDSYKKRKHLQDAIYEIKNAMWRQEDKLNEETGVIEQDFAEQLEPHLAILTEKKFLLECKHIHMEEFSDKFEVSSGYRDEKVIHKPAEIIYVDDHCRIEAYITKNDRPKNCFSLAIVGNSRLISLMGSKPYSYGCSFNTENANIQIEVHHNSTETEAIGWLAKNKHKILKDFITEHLELIPKYEQAVIDTDNPEWERLSLEREKYYYEHRYSRGTETPEYLEICEKLDAMKTPEELQAEEDALVKKYYFPVKLVGHGKTPDEAFNDAVDGFSRDPGVMDEYEEADEDTGY